MATAIPNGYKLAAISGTIVPSTDTIKCALFTSSLTPNIDTQVYYSDIIANEISGTGYTAGGVTLTGKTLTQNNTTDRGVFDANDPTWTVLTAPDIRYAVLYKSTGTSSTSQLMVIYDLGAQSQTGASFTVQFDTAGALYIG